MGEPILLVDDEEDTVELLSQLLINRGYDAKIARSARECLERLEDESFDLVITDHEMPGMTGVELCRELARRRPDIATMILTGRANLDVAVEAIRAGAFDFLTKPARADHLALAVARALDHYKVVREVMRLRTAIGEAAPIQSLVGTSPAMRKLAATVRRIADSDASVLISGESGSGKELVARALHESSQRRAEPFLAINCGAVPSELLESELFGHVRGAFTDAKVDRPGLFIQAGRGTVFLDEIGEMPIEMQSKLLRALQERRVRPVGGDVETPFQARLVAATNRDLETEVEEGRFREDLFHRVNVLAIEVPPLRDRTGDILLIASAILAKIAARTHKPEMTLAPIAARKLVDYPWPGNVRELENSLERAIAMAHGTVIDETVLPKKILEHQPTKIAFDMDAPDQLVTLDEMIYRYTKRVLESVQGNKTRAARVLGIDRRSLYRRLEYVRPAEDDK